MGPFLKTAFLFACLSFITVFAYIFSLNFKEPVTEKNDIKSNDEIAVSSYGEDAFISKVLESKEESTVLTEALSEESPTAESLESFEESIDVKEANLSDDIVFPGEMLIVTMKGLNDPVISAPFAKKITPYKTGEGIHSALIAVDYRTNPSDYVIRIEDGDYLKELLLKVEYKEFPTTSIEVDKSTADSTVNNNKANEEYHNKLQAIKGDNLPVQIWKGTFEIPVKEYRLTSDFGEIRYVNGKESGRHGGIDLAAPTGTPVFAPNDGVVVFAENLALTGNTVMIDHGLGLKTLYYHMNSISCNKGDEIAKGGKIGEVGTTGFSTGPHLHFAVAVEGTYVNPHTFFEKDYSNLIN